jgi:multidrug efflux pump
VENLSSFIGIDGTNTTLNSGRILINLKPLEERKDQRQRRDPPPAAALAEVAGITLFMQPVQDLTVEDRVSRTQFQYTLEDPSADELNSFAPKMVERLKELPQLTDVATDQQVQGLRATLVFDRDTASRWESRPPPSTRPSTTPTASGKSPPSSRSSTSITWCWK